MRLSAPALRLIAPSHPRAMPAPTHAPRATRSAALVPPARPVTCAEGTPPPARGPTPALPHAPRIVPQVQGLPSLRQPQRVQDDAHMLLEFAREDGPASPTLRWQFDIKSAALEGAGLRQEVLRDLHLEATRRALGPWLADAAEAGLQLRLVPSEAGVDLTLEGSSAPAQRLLDETLQQLTRGVPSYEAFCDSRDSVRQAYEAAATGRTPLRERHTPAQRCLALDGLRVYDLLGFGRRLADSTYVLGFLYGNMTPADVESARATLAHHLQGRAPYHDGRLHHRRRASPSD